MRKKRAFTLVELVVVLAIIALFIAMLFPAIQMARESARRTTCQSHLGIIALGLQNYESARQVFPPGSNWWETGKCGFSDTYDGWSWSTFVLPEINQSSLYEKIDFNSPMGAGDPQQAAVATTGISTYVCPSDPSGGTTISDSPHCPVKEFVVSNFAGVADSRSAECLQRDGMLFLLSSIRSDDIKAGASQTLFVGEVTGEKQFAWIAGNIASTGSGINTTGFSSYHEGGCYFAYVDGHVSFLSEQIDPAVLAALTSREGSEDVDSESK